MKKSNKKSTLRKIPHLAFPCVCISRWMCVLVFVRCHCCVLICLTAVFVLNSVHYSVFGCEYVCICVCLGSGVLRQLCEEPIESRDRWRDSEIWVQLKASSSVSSMSTLVSFLDLSEKHTYIQMPLTDLRCLESVSKNVISNQYCSFEISGGKGLMVMVCTKILSSTNIFNIYKKIK